MMIAHSRPGRRTRILLVQETTGSGDLKAEYSVAVYVIIDDTMGALTDFVVNSMPVPACRRVRA